MSKTDKLDADYIAAQLKSRKKMRIVLFAVMPVLAVVSYLVGYGTYIATSSNWVTWIPGN